MDPIIEQIATYVSEPPAFSKGAFESAQRALMDAIGCAYLALSTQESQHMLGPWIEGTHVPDGILVPGVKEPLDPLQGAFQWSSLIRWLDYNDTWLAKEWGHPSDNLGAILAAAQMKNLSIEKVLEALIQAYEIQGVLALSLSCHQLGLDHVYFVKIASSAVATSLLGGHHNEIANAVSHAFIDNAPLRVYRQGTSAGSRKSWAAGDASSRGLFFALLTLRKEMGYPQAIEQPIWGVQEALFKNQKMTLCRPLGEYVIDHILFKVQFPAEFHAQTAIEAAIQLHPKVQDKWDTLEKIEIYTHDSALKIIDKKGPLKNRADRDHCLQYMVAVALIFGHLEEKSYEASFAKNPLIDALREKMVVIEDPTFSTEYHDPNKRSIANRLVLHFSKAPTESVTVAFPLGHKVRRNEALPHLKEKFSKNVASFFSQEKAEALLAFMTHLDPQIKTKTFVKKLINPLQ